MTTTAIVINGDTVGRGSDELGGRLMLKCLHQMAGVATKPDVIVFYNTGVRLLAAGSPVLDAVKALEGHGVELLACGTCVDFFGLRDQIAAGRVSDMREIVTALLTAEKVVTL